jgi:hypothetical protein
MIKNGKITKAIVYIIILASVMTNQISYPQRFRDGKTHIGRYLDYIIYIEAAKGNSSELSGMSGDGKYWGWLYPHWAAKLWVPFTWLDFETGFFIWMMILTASYLYLSKKIMEYDYGFLFALAGIKPFLCSLEGGSILPILAAAMLTPIGTLLAGSIKYWPFGYLGVHFGLWLTDGSKRKSFIVRLSEK